MVTDDGLEYPTAGTEWVTVDELGEEELEGVDVELETLARRKTLIVVGDSILKARHLKQDLEQELGREWDVGIGATFGANLRAGRLEVEEWIRATAMQVETVDAIIVNLGMNNFPRTRPGRVMDILNEARSMLRVMDDIFHNVPVKMWMEVLPRGPSKGEIVNTSIQEFNREMGGILEEQGWRKVSLGKFWRGQKAVVSLLGDDLHLTSGGGTNQFAISVRKCLHMDIQGN